MEESRPANKLSFVLYKNKAVPKFFEVDKGFFRLFFYGLPIVTLISILITASLLVYFKQIREMAKRKEPAIIRELKDKNLKLQEKVQEVQVTNTVLEKKLITGASDTGLSTMSLFKIPPGQKDMTKSPDLAVESVSSSQGNGSYTFKFNLSNNSKNQEKIAGYIFVMMKSGNTYGFYPEDVFSENEMQMDFNKGEYFATSRFRPVDAKFTLPTKAGTALFKVLVFSRTGDLLLKQIIARKIEL
ncbi:MAG: hypothetical protein CME70_00140 [Halobacteriovorax sp.]|nr:hypothetical protein [Halobacteriovorax sp.]|tara:strand:+ start:2541 stop:3269 length:729 start_codon:yes stop_codon:yes gene_type:complete